MTIRCCQQLETVVYFGDTASKLQSSELALEGLSGPAKAVTVIQGSVGLLVCRWIRERLSEDSGDQEAPMMGREVLSVALSKGI